MEIAWTPEDGHQGWGEEGYSIPPHLKGKGRARTYGPIEGRATPEEQDSPRWGSPQPGSQAKVYVPLPSSFIDTAQHVHRFLERSVFVRLGAPIKIERQDGDLILISLH